MPGPVALVLDPAEVAVDQSPPDSPRFKIRTVTRGHLGEDQRGCRQSATSCDDLMQVVLSLEEVHDDRTPAARIGYIVDVEGSYGAELSHSQPFVANEGVLYLHLFEAIDRQDDPINFKIQLTAVDLGGNMSEPSETKRYDDEPNGCAQSTNSSTLFPVLLLILALRLARRGSARRSGATA